MLRLFSKNVTITKARSFLCFTDDFYKGFVLSKVPLLSNANPFPHAAPPPPHPRDHAPPSNSWLVPVLPSP